MPFPTDPNGNIKMTNTHFWKGCEAAGIHLAENYLKFLLMSILYLLCVTVISLFENLPEREKNIYPQKELHKNVHTQLYVHQPKTRNNANVINRRIDK